MVCGTAPPMVSVVPEIEAPVSPAGRTRSSLVPGSAASVPAYAESRTSVAGATVPATPAATCTVCVLAVVVARSKVEP
jgi:hypothetical protein